jgi:hypothetical protein
MAAITKNRNFFKWSKLLYFKPESAQIKIEQFWPFEEISIFSNGGHLRYRTALTDIILKGNHPGTIPVRFGLIWLTKLWWNGSWMAPFQNCVR